MYDSLSEPLVCSLCPNPWSVLFVRTPGLFSLSEPLVCSLARLDAGVHIYKENIIIQPKNNNRNKNVILSGPRICFCCGIDKREAKEKMKTTQEHKTTCLINQNIVLSLSIITVGVIAISCCTCSDL